MNFSELELIEPLLRAVSAEGYETPTPIQVQAIPHILAGRDLLGLAQTGTGKTAAFALPVLQRLAKTAGAGADRRIRVLVLTPTRELASQIGDSFAAYGKNLSFRHTVIFGGVGQLAQERALRSGIDILVATPGRLLDLIKQKLIHLQHLSIFVLDEADRMLDMGFIHDVKKVIAFLPPKRQTLFFSATMPKEAQMLADILLHSPARVQVTPLSSTVDKIEQAVYFVDKKEKRVLLSHLLKDPSLKRALVFTRTKHSADRVAEHLVRNGIEAQAIHGNKSQNARERALEGFRQGKTRVLVATDLAARGIDIDDISHVINYDVPNVPETYVHRIGRTARAGSSGIALSFCDQEERSYVHGIERLIKRTIPVLQNPRQRGGDEDATTEIAASPPSRPTAPGRYSRDGHSTGGRSGGQGGRPSGNRSSANRPAARPATPFHARPALPSSPTRSPAGSSPAQPPARAPVPPRSSSTGDPSLRPPRGFNRRGPR